MTCQMGMTISYFLFCLKFSINFLTPMYFRHPLNLILTLHAVKVLQDRGIVRSTKFIDLLTLPLRLTEIGPKVKVSVNGTKALGNKPKKVRI